MLWGKNHSGEGQWKEIQGTRCEESFLCPQRTGRKMSREVSCARWDWSGVQETVHAVRSPWKVLEFIPLVESHSSILVEESNLIRISVIVIKYHLAVILKMDWKGDRCEETIGGYGTVQDRDDSSQDEAGDSGVKQ